jgi:hypothetical protein
MILCHMAIPAIPIEYTEENQNMFSRKLQSFLVVVLVTGEYLILWHKMMRFVDTDYVV